MRYRKCVAVVLTVIVAGCSSDEPGVVMVDPVDLHCDYLQTLDSRCTTLAEHFDRVKDEQSATAAAREIVDACSDVFSAMQQAKQLPELNESQQEDVGRRYRETLKKSTHKAILRVGKSADTAFGRVPAASGMVEVAATWQVLTAQIHKFLPTLQRLTRSQ